MSYKFSKGAQVIGDLKAADDQQRDTQIDFEEDYIGFITSGSTSLVLSGSKVGIGTTNPDYRLDVAGNIGLNEYIYHNGDANTFMRFGNGDEGDRIRFNAGGINFVGMHKKSSQPHLITFNSGNNNIDFLVKGNDNNDPALLYVDADQEAVGFGTENPQTTLHVEGGCILNGRTVIQTTSSQIDSAELLNGSISFYLDEGNNQLKVRVKYSDGQLKTGTIALS